MGRVVVVKAPWTEAYLKELMFFPHGRYKDQVDASAGGQTVLAEGMRVAGGIRSRSKNHEEEYVQNPRAKYRRT
jgi:hypothetical protein